MSDPFENFQDQVTGSARRPYAIAADDNVALPIIPKGIYVGAGGDVTLRGIDATADVTYKNLSDGSYIAVRALYIRSTGTTASHLIAEA